MSIEANMPLAEIALNAAISLDMLANGAPFQPTWLTRLSAAIESMPQEDMRLFPVYDHALTAAGAGAPQNRGDLFAKLAAVSSKLGKTSADNEFNVSDLRDFCLALHEGLLNQRYEQHYAAVSAARRYA